VNAEKQSQGNGIEVIQGRNGPGLDRYLRWKSFSNSLACSSSVASNHLESLSVSSYPSHITLYSSLHALQQSILESTILEISYSGSPSMITSAGRGSECCCVTNFIQPYLHQFSIDSHGPNGYGKPLKRPFDRYQSRLEAISNGRDIRQINW